MIMEVKTGQELSAGRSRRSWPLFPLVFFLILGGVSLLLHLEKSHRQKEVLAAKVQSSVMVHGQPVEMVKVQRGQFYKIQYYLGYPSATSYAVADFVRRLSAAIPLRHVRDLQIDPGLQNFSFQLTVGIAAGGPERAQLAAASYLEEVRKFPEIMQIALAKIDPLPGTGGGNRVRFFSITGWAEMR
jgi:hypothetical protein